MISIDITLLSTHCSRRARIHRTMSNVFVLLLDSSLIDFPVTWEISRPLAPFNFFVNIFEKYHYVYYLVQTIKPSLAYITLCTTMSCSRGPHFPGKLS